MKYVAKWLAAALLLGGCATAPAEHETALVLAPNLRLDPPRPADMGQTIEVVQMITAHHDGRDFSFEAHLSITPQRVLLAGVDPMGQRVMTVTWQESGIRVDASPFLPKDVRPGSMLADIVVLYWPEEAVRRALAPAGATLRVTESSRDIIAANGKEVLHADYQSGSANPWSGGLRYRNAAWNYDIDVETLQVSQ
jgi:hypothetical protein